MCLLGQTSITLLNQTKKKLMMKVGDAVVLSAYGKKISTIKKFDDDVGLVIKDEHWGRSVFVKWTRGGFFWMNRRDIKMLR